MTSVARCALLVALTAALACSASAQTQQDSASLTVTKVALAAFAARQSAMADSAGNGRRLVFDPAIVAGRYDTVLRFPTTPAPTHARDSVENAALAAALGGVVVREHELVLCTTNKLPDGCRVPPLESRSVAVGEADIAGDDATVLLQTMAPYDRNGRVTTGRTVSTWLVRAHRANDTWTVRCMTTVATDAPVPRARIEQACPATPTSRRLPRDSDFKSSVRLLSHTGSAGDTRSVDDIFGR